MGHPFLKQNKSFVCFDKEDFFPEAPDRVNHSDVGQGRGYNPSIPAQIFCHFRIPENIVVNPGTLEREGYI